MHSGSGWKKALHQNKAMQKKEVCNILRIDYCDEWQDY